VSSRDVCDWPFWNVEAVSVYEMRGDYMKAREEERRRESALEIPFISWASASAGEGCCSVLRWEVGTCSVVPCNAEAEAYYVVEKHCSIWLGYLCSDMREEEAMTLHWWLYEKRSLQWRLDEEGCVKREKRCSREGIQTSDWNEDILLFMKAKCLFSLLRRRKLSILHWYVVWNAMQYRESILKQGQWGLLTMC